MNKLYQSKLSLFCALLCLSGCATTAQFAPSQLTQTYPPRTPPYAIELFRSSSPTKKYWEIGSISACCDADSNRIIELLKENAAENGGDALIDLDIKANGAAAASVIRYEEAP